MLPVIRSGRSSTVTYGNKDNCHNWQGYCKERQESKADFCFFSVRIGNAEIEEAEVVVVWINTR